MQLGEPDASGRRRPEATGETIKLKCDQVIVAVGVSPNPLVPQSIEGLELGRKNTIAVNEQMQSSQPAIYAGGDIVRGALQRSNLLLQLRLVKQVGIAGENRSL